MKGNRSVQQGLARPVAHHAKIARRDTETSIGDVPPPFLPVLSSQSRQSRVLQPDDIDLYQSNLQGPQSLQHARKKTPHLSRWHRPSFDVLWLRHFRQNI